VVLEMRVEFVSNGFLPLLPAFRMIESFLDRSSSSFGSIFAIRTRGALSKSSSANFLEVVIPLFDLAEDLCVPLVKPPVAGS
jgi:hypothetical protein